MGSVAEKSGIWAVVPVKSLGAAKQRLAPMLAPDLRRALVLAMLSDVLASLAETPMLSGILVISPDGDVLDLAGQADAACCAQAGDIGFAASADEGSRVVSERYNAAGVMIVPADLPCATSADFDVVARAHAGYGCTIAPSWDGGGSNCVVLSPPGAMKFLFGVDSFDRHLKAAAACGIAANVVQNHNIGFDIDEPADFLRLGLVRGGLHTRQFFRERHPVSLQGTFSSARGAP